MVSIQCTLNIPDFVYGFKSWIFSSLLKGNTLCLKDNFS